MDVHDAYALSVDAIAGRELGAYTGPEDDSGPELEEYVPLERDLIALAEAMRPRQGRLEVER